MVLCQMLRLSVGKELKLFLRNLTKRKNREGTLQARLGRCPKCQKTLQEPEDSPAHRCSRCETALQSKHSKSEGKVARISDISVSEATLLSAEQCDFRAEDDPEDDGSKVRKTQHVYDPPASSSRTRSYDSEAAYEHEKSDFRKEWLRRGKFPVTSDSDMLVHGRSSAYSIRYKSLPPVPFYPASSSLSSSKQRNYHQLKHFRQYEREGWSGETSSTSSIHFSGETTDSRYYQLLSGQSPVRHFRHQRFPGQSFYDYSSSFMAIPLRSERPYPVWSSKTESCSQKGTCSDMNGDVKERIPVVKRHVLPTAGGAPFVTCYYCSELLQLSQVFLHCKKKRYLVRCGCCSGVLKFSSNVLDPCPSHRDDSDSSDHLEDRGSASVDHKECCPDKGHLSYSDKDCEDSVCKSRLSNDGELVSPLKSLAKSQDAYSEHSHNMYENPNERSDTIDAGKVSIDGSGVSMEDIGYKNEKTNETTEEEEAKTTEDRPVSDMEAPAKLGIKKKVIAWRSLKNKMNMEGKERGEIPREIHPDCIWRNMKLTTRIRKEDLAKNTNGTMVQREFQHFV